MQRDLNNHAELEALLRHFYRLVLADSIIGYLFVDVAKIDLDAHLPKVVDFWHDLLFATKQYDGGIFAAHLGVHKQVPLKPAISHDGYTYSNAQLRNVSWRALRHSKC